MSVIKAEGDPQVVPFEIGTEQQLQLLPHRFEVQLLSGRAAALGFLRTLSWRVRRHGLGIAHAVHEPTGCHRDEAFSLCYGGRPPLRAKARPQPRLPFSVVPEAAETSSLPARPIPWLRTKGG